MKKEELESGVKDLLSVASGISEEKITGDSNVINDLGLDSLDRVELVQNLEDKFDVVISDDEAEEITEVKGIVSLLESKLA
jgi:acyl carrier protein